MLDLEKMHRQATIYQAIGDSLSQLANKTETPGSRFFDRRGAYGRRLVQVFLESELGQTLWGIVGEEQSGAPRIGPVLGTGAIRADFAGSRIRVRPAKFAALHMRFVGIWVFITMRLLLRALTGSRKAPTAPATLVYGLSAGQILQNVSDAEFVRFCAETKIEALRAGRLYVEVPGLAARSSDRVIYCERALQTCLEDNFQGTGDFLRFMRTHAMALIEFIQNTIRAPASVLLFRDYAWLASADFLNKKGALSAVVTTNTKFMDQRLWMNSLRGRAFKLHMAWYSTNNKGTLFTQAEPPIFPAYPPFRFMTYDVGWYWTEDHASATAAVMGEHDQRVVGPILFREPPPQVERSRTDEDPREFIIGLFDVTPVTVEMERMLGLAYNYYNSKTVTAFVEDVIDTAERLAKERNIRVRVELKPKRVPGSTHDDQYLRFIQDLSHRKPILKLIDPQTNLFEMVGRTHVSIAIPYSSPVYVAASIQKPSIFFDPSGQLVPHFDRAPGLRFCSGKDSLFQAFLDLSDSIARA